MDDDNTLLLTLANIFELAHLAFVDNVAGIRSVRIDAGQDIHQRGLSRTIFATKRVNLALFHNEIDIAERLDAGELLDDMAHFQNVLCHTMLLFSPDHFVLEHIS